MASNQLGDAPLMEHELQEQFQSQYTQEQEFLFFCTLSESRKSGGVGTQKGNNCQNLYFFHQAPFSFYLQFLPSFLSI